MRALGFAFRVVLTVVRLALGITVALAAIAQEPDAEQLMARGAAMDSHQVVAYALAQLKAARRT